MKKLIVLLRSHDGLKTVTWIAPVCYSIKMQVTCIKVPKTYNTLRRVTKVHFENFLLKNMAVLPRSCHYFKTVICNWSSLIWKKKCRQRVSKALKPITHLEKFWKWIWTIAVKIYFININSFTKARHGFKTVSCNCSTLTFWKNPDNVCHEL